MNDDDGAVACPAGTPVRRWAREQALSAAVAGAPGWYAAGECGAVNVRHAPAVFAWPDPDGVPEERYRIVAAHPAGDGWSIEVGPYRYQDEAARVARQVLILAHDPGAWPPAENPGGYPLLDG